MCSLCVTFDIISLWFFFFFKQKTAYEMRISDWSSDVCSSDLPAAQHDRLDPPGIGDAGQRVAVQQHQVGTVPRRDAAGAVAQPVAGRRRRRLQALLAGQARVYQCPPPAVQREAGDGHPSVAAGPGDHRTAGSAQSANQGVMIPPPSPPYTPTHLT